MLIRYAAPRKPPKQFKSSSDTIVIGRARPGGEAVDLDLTTDEYASQRHAVLEHADGVFWIDDLGSANGTWVNDRQISQKTRVSGSDEIRIGYTLISILSEEADDRPPSADGSPRPAGHHRDSAPATASAPDDRTMAPGIESDEPIRDAPDIGIDDRTIAGETGLPVTDDQDSPTAVEAGATVSDERTMVNADEERPPVVDHRPLSGVAETDSDRAARATLHAASAAASDMGGVVEITEAVICGDDITDSTSDALTRINKRLDCFNGLCQAIAAARDLNELMEVQQQMLPRVIPGAQRGALLMPDSRGKLLLKTHWPPGELSISMTWINRAYEEREAFIWAAPSDHRRDSTPDSAVLGKVKSAMYVPLLVDKDVLGVMVVDNAMSRKAFSGNDYEMFKAVAHQTALYVKQRVIGRQRQLRASLNADLSRHFSPDAAPRIIERMQAREFDGERVDPVTILIADIRGFTALSASMSAGGVVKMLNEMFDAFVPIIFDNGGVIDKYIGDSVLAVFGSPEPDYRQWEHAIRAAMEMQRAVEKINEGRQVRRLPEFQVGIGIHTGSAIHGFIGSTLRKEYTVIGKTVNLASRYCDGAGPGEIVISKSVFEHVYRWVSVKPKTIKTKHADTEPDLQGYIIEGISEEDD